LPVQEQIVSYDNPLGKLTNSDLELTGIVMHQAILGMAKVDGETAQPQCDNTPAATWQEKESTMTT
jgi:hypothetical protein